MSLLLLLRPPHGTGDVDNSGGGGGDVIITTLRTFVGDWSPPDADEELLASLPFHEAQIALAGVPQDPRAARITGVGWHGSTIDYRLGSFAVARRGGELADWLGERIRITNLANGRFVFAYLHLLVDDLPDALTLTRGLQVRIGLLAADELTCRIEIVE